MSVLRIHSIGVNDGQANNLIAKQTNWESVENRLMEERERKLPLTDTSKAIRRFNLAFKVARKNQPASKKSGLIEQQARFARLRQRGA